MPRRPGLPVLHAILLVVAWFGLGAGTGCARPDVVLKQRPAQRVELLQNVNGMTADEASALVSRIEADMGIPASPQPPGDGGGFRVIRIRLHGGPDRTLHWGLGRTWLASMGVGALAGAVAGSGGPYAGPGTWTGPEIGAGLGLVLGTVYGPVVYRDKLETLQELGYLPWKINVSWEVLDRQGSTREDVAARSSRKFLDLRPFVRPVPEGPDRAAAVRRMNLQACAKALVAMVRGKAPVPARRP